MSFGETRGGEDTSETTLVQPAVPDATQAHPVEPTQAQPTQARPTQIRPVQARLRPAAAGRKLQDRYRLDELLVDRGDTQTWRAYDEKLLRPIVVHLLPANERGNRLLAAARQIACASYDSRVLRVLDASAPADADNPETDNFVVCDFAEGETLEDLLAVGSMRRREAVTFVREVAEALIGMHAQGLYHRALSPALVTLTCEGNVKIAGFLFAAELSPARTPINPEAADVQALGHMLRALGADESSNANLAQASARILDPAHPAPLRTAAQVTAHLTRALNDPPPPPPAGEAERTRAHPTPSVISQEPVDTPWSSPRKGFRWAWVVVPLLVAVIIGTIVAVPLLHNALTGSASTASPGAAASERWSVVAAQDFDPEGNGEERPNQVSRAWDGDPNTSWRTMNYWEAEIGNKTGVGLIFDLGEVRRVSRVELDLDGAGTSLEVRVPATEATTRPPLQGVGQWTVVGQALHAPAATTVTLDAPAGTRFVLVYLTELPRDGSAFTGGIAEARFWS
ncbi:hypothetical protein AADG42_01310 [Ammonicoccus fulvus]|uniref:Protein kinase domain-containing protein n=1 Tax=Ammonicoccus fulvus TaxID=3138240 RepID=A0ABZ3FJ38_9ACTN